MNMSCIFANTGKLRFALMLFVMQVLSLSNVSPADEPTATAPKNRVYVKILLPKKEPAKDKHPAVETWIKDALEKQRGRPELRAVTDWMLLPDVGEKPARLWTSILDGEQWGCPVSGSIANWSDDGKVKVSLSGWSPDVAEVTGTTLPAEVGSRGMAEVDYGTEQEAFVAILIGPPLPKTTAEKKSAN